MSCRKGMSITNLQAFIEERYGAGVWMKVLEPLSDEDRTAVSSVDAGEWYPIELHNRINRAACDVVRDGSLTLAQEVGRFSAERDFKVTGRWALRCIPIRFALENLDLFWREDEDAGYWRSSVEPDKFVADLYGWEAAEPVLCQRLLHYMGRILEYLGPVESFEHPVCRAHGGDHCSFQFRCRLHDDAPRPEPLSSAEDILELARELTRYAERVDQDAVANATVRLLLSERLCSYVEIWVPGSDEGEPRKRYAGGARSGGTMKRVPLDYQSWLDVESAPDNVRAALLEKLRFWIAHALKITDSTRRSVEDCLRVARANHGIEGREVDVLRLRADGASNKTIAERLMVQESTVEMYVTRIYQKFRTNNKYVLMKKFWLKK